MSLRRAWLLQKMGITQFNLRRPYVLRSEIALTYPQDMRLIIVADIPLDIHDTLIMDVLCAMDITQHQILSITVEQLTMMFLDNLPCLIWGLGIDIQIEQIISPKLFTPPLEILHIDVEAKRALWKQICEYKVTSFTYLK